MNRGGGGIVSQSGYILVTESVNRDNVTNGFSDNGGGIPALNGLIEIRGSSIVGNRSGGPGGGAMFGGQNVQVIDNTISGNTAAGLGGGIYGQQDTVVTYSTVSGNSTIATSAQGGGIRSRAIIIQFSTITDNHTVGIDAHGGGLAAVNFTTLQGSIAAGNTAGSEQGDDLWGNGNLFYSLLGSNVGTTGIVVAEGPVGSPDALFYLATW